MPRQNYQICNAGEGPNILDQMEILNAETYDAEAASIARSLTELARRPPVPPPHMFGMTGGFEAVMERRMDVPRVAAQRVEVKETKTRKARKARGANLEEDEEDKGGRRRKKQKLSEDEDGDEDDASKKSRGRPRLDTKDETAADVGVYISPSHYLHSVYSEDGNGSWPRGAPPHQWLVYIGSSCHILLWITGIILSRLLLHK
jgi:hypothetical protein